VSFPSELKALISGTKYTIVQIEKNNPIQYTVPKATDDFTVNNEKKKHSSYGMKSFIQ
jgi:hypothetical protein